MKIETLKLKELETYEENGEFKSRYINEKKYPAYLTNAGMRRGRDLGLIEHGLMAEVANLKDLMALESIQEGDEMAALEALEIVDEDRMMTVIYLAFISANKDKEMSIEEFYELYHNDITQTLTLYVKLLTGAFSNDNKFAAEFKKATKNDKKK